MSVRETGKWVPCYGWKGSSVLCNYAARSVTFLCPLRLNNMIKNMLISLLSTKFIREMNAKENELFIDADGGNNA